MSKHDQIKQHIESGKPITGLQALKQYGVYRLSSVINRLRKDGLNIITQMVEENGEKYAKYQLVKQ